MRTTLALKAEEAIAKQAKDNQRKATGGDRRSQEYQGRQNSVHLDTEMPKQGTPKPSPVENKTETKIAKIAGVSRDTVQKVKAINKKADERTKELLREAL